MISEVMLSTVMTHVERILLLQVPGMEDGQTRKFWLVVEREVQRQHA
jgi:hypothetical protein